MQTSIHGLSDFLDYLNSMSCWLYLLTLRHCALTTTETGWHHYNYIRFTPVWLGLPSGSLNYRHVAVLRPSLDAEGNHKSSSPILTWCHICAPHGPQRTLDTALYLSGNNTALFLSDARKRRWQRVRFRIPAAVGGRGQLQQQRNSKTQEYSRIRFAFFVANACSKHSQQSQIRKLKSYWEIQLDAFKLVIV